MSVSNDIDAQIRDISIQLNKLTRSMHLTVGQNKALKRRAGSELYDYLEFTAPLGKTGNLASSIKWLPFKGNDVFVGPSFRIAPHAHLVEYGFVHYKDGKLKNKAASIGWIRKSFDKYRNIILRNLIKEATKELEKIGRELEVPA